MPKIANVYQDKKNGSWYFVASLGFDEKGKRVQHWERGYPTQKEAKSAYDDYMNDYSKTAIKKNSSMSYQEFYTTYFEPDYKRSVKKRTYDNRVSSMRIHFAYFYKRKLNEISPPMIKKWQNKLSEKYSSAYIRNIYGLFQMSLDLAVKLGLLQKNVVKQVGNVKKTKKKVDFWTQAEFESVIATFDTSDYYQYYSFMLIWLLFMTGLRFGEAQALEWDKDIDFENKTLRVNKSMYYKNAEEYYITEPKTTASNRVIAIDSDTIRYLKNWKIAQENCGGSKWILSYNGLPTNKSAPYHIIQRHSELAGVHRIKTHALRHSHASLLISLGENAIVVRDRLGHEDIKTTLGTYGHLYPNTNVEVANRLVGLINVETNEMAIKETKKFSGNQYIKKEGK